MGLIHKHLQSLRMGKRCKYHANAACNRNRGRLRELTLTPAATRGDVLTHRVPMWDLAGLKFRLSPISHSLASGFDTS